jgi:signal transduction histidine kinase
VNSSFGRLYACAARCYSRSPMLAELASVETKSPWGEHGSVWLVEDSPLEAELACRALSGFELEVFRDGPSMLERRSTHGGPNVLILDGQLPGMSGLEICRFLRATVDEVTLPILMLTVQGNKVDIVEALSGGANDYLTKPYDAAELVARVGGLNRMRRLYGDLQVERQRLKAIDAERERLLAHANDGWKKADEANRGKDDFLAVVSHELRTPLNAISGWVSLLKGGQLPAEKAKHALDTIERNARSQTQLIDDLLDVSRIISGKLHMQMELVNFEDLMRLAYDAVEPQAQAKGLRLSIDVAPGNYEVVGDAGRLQQVVWNILNNAVKFTPEGGNIALRLVSDDRVRLSVSDTGRGIDAQLLPFIFDRFRQAESSVTRRHGGLGLGLAIVKHLAELHGGRVRAESAGEGRGATFSLELELASGVPSDVAREARAQPKPSGSELSELRVLIVDDDEDCRDVLAHVLGLAGANVRLAASASAALDSLSQELPDVMVSDIGMPDEDGFSLIKKVRARAVEQGGKLPAVALTAYARREDRAAALRAGFNGHVSKPVEAAEIIAVVGSLCGRFQ